MTREVMQRNVWKDIANFANKTTQQLYKVAMPCLDENQFREEEIGSVRRIVHSLSHKLYLKCLYVWHVLVDLIFYRLWTNLLVRPQNGTRACDERLARLISYHTCEYKQYFLCGKHSTQQCRTWIVSRLCFCKRPLKTQNQHHEGFLCIFGSRHVRANKLDV